MWYLFLEIWFGLLVAFSLGWFGHWFLSRRSTRQAKDEPDGVQNSRDSGQMT